MPLTKCSRCHRRTNASFDGANCMALDRFATHPCMGTMRRTTAAGALRVWHLVNHMKVWEEHLRRLQYVYLKEAQMGDASATAKYREVQSDIVKMKEWRERLDSIDPRRNRKDGVSVLQGNDGDSMPQPEQPSINDPPVQ